jgi:hypothetical protein
VLTSVAFNKAGGCKRLEIDGDGDFDEDSSNSDTSNLHPAPMLCQPDHAISFLYNTVPRGQAERMCRSLNKTLLSLHSDPDYLDAYGVAMRCGGERVWAWVSIGSGDVDTMCSVVVGEGRVIRAPCDQPLPVLCRGTF